MKAISKKIGMLYEICLHRFILDWSNALYNFSLIHTD